jgi:hypothetical protein
MSQGEMPYDSAEKTEKVGQLSLQSLECCRGPIAIRPLGVGETGLGAIEGHWWPPPAAGWCGGMGMLQWH